MTTDAQRHWFVAVLVFESRIAERWSDPSVDLQFRLIHATDAEAAYQRALAMGRDAELAYENPHGETCVWTFHGLKDLQDIIEDELGDGVEIYGFIEDGSAEDHVVEKADLTAFLGGAIPDDEFEGE